MPSPAIDNRHRTAAFLSTLFCVLLLGLMIGGDFSLPKFIMNSVAGTTGLSLSETTRAIAVRIISLSIISIFAMIASTALNAPGRKGVTPLMQAALSDRTSILKVLLEASANPNVKDENGSTALVNAVTMGSVEAVKILIEHGADPNTVDAYGITVLQVAQSSGQQDLVEALITAGAKCAP